MNDVVNYAQAGLPTQPGDMQEYYRKMAEAYASSERAAGNTISIKNGIMSVADQPIPGNQFAAVIVDAVRLNTFYMSAYNPNSTEPPNCYAIGRNDADLAPHPDMAKDPNHFRPQAHQCLGCPMNEFGSGRDGVGKSCTNRRRIYMLLAGQYNQTPGGLQLAPYMDPDHYATTPFLQMQLPPTSLKGWGEYVRAGAAQYQRPFFGLVTRVFLYSHPKHGKEAVGFETLGPTPADWDQRIFARLQVAQAEIMQGYEPPQARHPGGGFYGAQGQAR